jgi:hypothetical protein
MGAAVSAGSIARVLPRRKGPVASGGVCVTRGLTVSVDSLRECDFKFPFLESVFFMMSCFGDFPVFSTMELSLVVFVMELGGRVLEVEEVEELEGTVPSFMFGTVESLLFEDLRFMECIFFKTCCIKVQN